MSALDLYLLAFVCLAVLLGFVFHSVRIFRRAAEAGPLRDEVQRLLQEKKALIDEIAEAHRTLAELGRQIDAKRAEIEAGKEIIAKAEKEKQWLDEHEQLIVRLRAEEASLQEQVKNLTDKRNELQEEKDSLQKEKEGLETSVRDLKTEHARLSDSIAEKNQELETVKRRLAGHTEELATIDKELVPKREELERLNSKLASLAGLKNELSQLEDKIQQGKRELRETEEDIAKNRNRAQEIVDDARANASKIINNAMKTGQEHARHLIDAATGNLSRERRGLQDEINRLQETRARLLAEVGEWKQRNGSVMDCWKELDEPAVPNILVPEDFDRIEDSEEERIEAFKNNLNAHGLVFHPRIIQAFHTGLKIADASPLVVLAGISGTGKSLLPQLYAKAFGMNFLPLAVQPRWDSPQDMLGFYNYMEKRYKATELARLLWQYDIYNNVKTNKNFSDEGELPMNLVLLDEMNIARVEYYFSDFLSKLELRRGIDPNNENDRRGVEIEIEGGVPTTADIAGLSDSEKKQLAETFFSRRLFVGRNTLFVGTMNEDESTQTLSDKVIDRSNVIRFGKPATLATGSDTQGFMEEYEYAPGDKDDRMAFVDWSKWIVEKDDYSEQTKSDVVRIASQLNDEMEKMGRPFGIRNIQAILSYCENYPEQGDRGFKLAMADQIEMKVLPKLNGLEKDDATVRNGLGNILSILNKEIGDADEDPGDKNGLCRMFDAAIRPDSGVFFKWKGISR